VPWPASGVHDTRIDSRFNSRTREIRLWQGQKPQITQMNLDPNSVQRHGALCIAAVFRISGSCPKHFRHNHQDTKSFTKVIFESEISMQLPALGICSTICRTKTESFVSSS
jgi:hypothetical protein